MVFTRPRADLLIRANTDERLLLLGVDLSSTDEGDGMTAVLALARIIPEAPRIAV